ncbi:MAG: threonine-phosphate decarboxylase CobD [Thermodesulfobacteriota bacterium]
MKDIHGGDVWEAARALGLEPHEIIDFSSSINPLGPPKGALRAAARALKFAPAYPEPHSATLVRAFARRHGLVPGRVLAANGSVELIHLVPRVLRPERALIVEPAFSEYRAALGLAGSRVKGLAARAADSFRPSPARLAAALDAATGCPDLLFVANPANPTGALMEKAGLIEIIRLCRRRGTTVVVDEAFMDFTEGESVKDAVGRYTNLVVLRSMTKFYSLAGLRLGFLVASEAMVKRFSRSIPPWNVNTAAAAAAAAALTDDKFAARTLEWLSRERAYLARGLEATGLLRVYPSSANFLMAEITAGAPPAGELGSRLFRRGILIRDLAGFRGLGPRFFRVAVKGRRENRLLLAATGEALCG